MTEKNVGENFVLRSEHLSDTTRLLRLKTSSINNLNPADISFAEIDEMITSLSKNEFNDELITKYLGEGANPKQDNEVSLKCQRYSQSLYKTGEYLSGQNILFYGRFLPTYYKELLNYKKINNSDNHDSLLIGAFTEDTALDYQSTVKSIFTKAKSLVIDIEADYLKYKVPDFQIMDGLNTSFQDNSFDTIHTNALLHQLKDVSKNNYDKFISIEKLFKETYRLLKPGGKIIMVEGDLKDTLSLVINSHIENVIKRLLTPIGFSNINVKPAEVFSDSSNIDRFMRNSAGNHW